MGGCVRAFFFYMTSRQPYWSAILRYIEWSLRTFASMQAVRLFLRGQAVINFAMRAASTLEITNGEQRALR